MPLDPYRLLVPISFPAAMHHAAMLKQVRRWLAREQAAKAMKMRPWRVAKP